MMKKIIRGFSLVAIAFSMVFSLPVNKAVYAAGNEIKVTVDGKEVAFDQPPINKDGRVMVPVRFVAEALGWEVQYKAPYIYFTKEGQTVYSGINDRKWSISYYSTTVNLEENAIIKNINACNTKKLNETNSLLVNPVNENGRMLVGVRDLAEGLYAKVEWKEEIRTVVVTSKQLPYYAVSEVPEYSNWFANLQKDYNAYLGDGTVKTDPAPQQTTTPSNTDSTVNNATGTSYKDKVKKSLKKQTLEMFEGEYADDDLEVLLDEEIANRAGIVVYSGNYGEEGGKFSVIIVRNKATAEANKPLTEPPVVGTTLAKILRPNCTDVKDAASYYIAYGTSYNMGECTWYAQGRFFETQGIWIPDGIGNGGFWTKNITKYSKEVKVITNPNDIQAYSIAEFNEKDSNGNITTGHVYFIEYVERDSQNNPTYIYYTDANGTNDLNKSQYDVGYDCVVKKKSFNEFINHWTYRFAGYIVPKN